MYIHEQWSKGVTEVEDAMTESTINLWIKEVGICLICDFFVLIDHKQLYSSRKGSYIN
jgi:hypothetical protein